MKKLFRKHIKKLRNLYNHNSMKNVRLPNYIKPERYQLTIKPNLEGFTFEGEETISLIINRPTNLITLHSKELDVYEVMLKNSKFESRNSSFQNLVY